MTIRLPVAECALRYLVGGSTSGMCEILTKLGHQSTLDVQFRHGDPLYVTEDNHSWGRYESKQRWIADGLGAHNWPGGFLIIKVPEVPASVFQKFVAPHADCIRQRDHTINLSGIDIGNGFVIADRDQVMASLRSKLTGLAAEMAV